MHKIEMPEDYALVLQQINEHGQEDITSLAESLRIRRSRLAHIVDSLRHKGLVRFSRDYRNDILIELSGKGRRLVRYLWPDSSLQHGF